MSENVNKPAQDGEMQSKIGNVMKWTSRISIAIKENDQRKSILIKQIDLRSANVNIERLRIVKCSYGERFKMLNAI